MCTVHTCHLQTWIFLCFNFNFIFRFLAATVFRPGGARRAFPCFDEPHLRAPFRISVFRDRFHIGLSNSIVHATDDVGFYMGTGLVSIPETTRKNAFLEKFNFLCEGL